MQAKLLELTATEADGKKIPGKSALKNCTLDELKSLLSKLGTLMEAA